MGVIEKTLDLFEGEDVLILVLVDKWQDEARLEVEFVFGLWNKVILVEDSVEKELGIID